MEKVAIKIISLDSFNREVTIDDINNEINIISKCHHKNVLKYYTSFTSDKELWVVMPLMSAGSLNKIMKTKAKNGIKDETLISAILIQIIEGLTYFHNKQLMHRDIKAENILVNENGQMVISNFGLTTTIKHTHKIITFVGSPQWMAPEKIE